ncbi:hypothetical protein RvY_16858 [Ramazzottius varieornatus]|uniref:Uncharacterized protein n=1 Tax=Ramazzottius varieornatus TaxID=947166 RepID=A0A1D1W0N7_RAMVA|nr:hypothetical protein RvY_16858 [Ramazzottius varieornatus]
MRQLIRVAKELYSQALCVYAFARSPWLSEPLASGLLWYSSPAPRISLPKPTASQRSRWLLTTETLLYFNVQTARGIRAMPKRPYSGKIDAVFETGYSTIIREIFEAIVKKFRK